MADPWMPGLTRDPGRGAGYPVAHTRMQFVVHHDTAGTNSYNICKWGRAGYQTSLCNILLPKIGRPWQFCEIDSLTYHAGSAQYGNYNGFGPGIEVERLSHDEALTADQAYWLAEIGKWLASEWDLPDVQYRGPHGHADAWRGHVNHSDLHPNPDGLTILEWDHIQSLDQPAQKDDDPMLYVFNPHVPSEIWCLAGNTRRHVTPDEWKFVEYVGGKAIKVTAAWFDSYPEAA